MSFSGVCSYYLVRGALQHGIQINTITITKSIISEIAFNPNIKWRLIIGIISLLLFTTIMLVISYVAIFSTWKLPDYFYSDIRNKEIKGLVGRNNDSGYNLRYLLGHDCKLTGFTINEADLHGARLRKSTFTNMTIQGAQFSHADLKNSTWVKGDLRGATFNDAHLNGVKFYGTKLTGTKWIEAKLPQAEFYGNKLEDSHFDGANLQGAKFINEPGFGDDLKINGASFKGADLRGADLRHLCLEKVNFTGANLKGTYLQYSDLEKANITREQLNEAFTYGAILPDRNRN